MIRLFPSILLLMWVGLTTIHAADDVFEFQISQEECYPGDIVRILATMRSSSVRDFHISIPHSDELHVIGIEKHPVHTETGSYVQTIQWIVQPTRAGTLVIEGAEAVIGSDTSQERISLPKLNLTVHSYELGDDSLDAESLPPDVVGNSGYTLYWLVGIIATVGLMAAIAYWRWPRKAELAGATPAHPTLADLLQLVTDNAAGQTLIESFLTDSPRKLSPQLRQAMEQCAYGEHPDWGALEKALIKEVGK